MACRSKTYFTKMAQIQRYGLWASNFWFKSIGKGGSKTRGLAWVGSSLRHLPYFWPFANPHGVAKLHSDNIHSHRRPRIRLHWFRRCRGVHRMARLSWSIAADIAQEERRCQCSGSELAAYLSSLPTFKTRRVSDLSPAARLRMHNGF